MTHEDDSVSTLDGPVLAGILARTDAGPVAIAGWGAATSRGHVRPRNEDSFGNDGDRFFVVADGMGGFSGGDIAADVAVRTLVAASADGIEPNWERWLLSANMAIRSAARQRGFERSGAAVAGCLFVSGVAFLAHVGDVRAYRVRGTELAHLTRDHTVEAELRAEGLSHMVASLSRRELAALTRYLGGSDELATPAVSSHEPEHGDRLLLCTDGVSRQLTAPEIVALCVSGTPQAAADALVALADDKGGTDNATAICLDFGRLDTTGTR